MGILDDAIREHLELRRRHGAREDELQRIEDEAFGLPARPGESPPAELPVEQRPEDEAEAPAEEPAVEETEVVDQAEAAVEGREPPTGDEARAAFHDQSFGPGEGELTEAAEVEEPPAAAAAAEPEAPEEATAPPEPEDTDLDIGDLDLDLDEERHEPPIESLETAEHPPPVEAQDTVEHTFEEVEAQDTVEHTFEEAIPEPGEGPVEHGEAPSDAAPATGEEEEVLEGEEVLEDEPGDEDVLEETPEFLRDQPEDDELWFEQGEPKDFDF